MSHEGDIILAEMHALRSQKYICLLTQCADTRSHQIRELQETQSPAASSSNASIGVYAEGSVDHIDFARFNAVVV